MGSTTRNYLILYNATMGIGWTYIFYEVTKLLFITYDPISANYVNPPSIKQLLNVVYILQACATLEIFHSLFGLVGGNVSAAVAQIVGRNHILFANIYFLPILWDHISVAYLLFFWSTIEVVRYPAYLFALISPDNILSRTFSWLRYTIFIPLYPLGFGTECTFCFIHLFSKVSNRFFFFSVDLSCSVGNSVRSNCQ